MKRRTQVTISILLALGGTYLVADAFDLTPGVLTARPLEEEPVDFPSVKADAALPVAIPTLDPNAPIPDAAAVDAALACLERSRSGWQRTQTEGRVFTNPASGVLQGGTSIM